MVLGVITIKITKLLESLGGWVGLVYSFPREHFYSAVNIFPLASASTLPCLGGKFNQRSILEMDLVLLGQRQGSSIADAWRTKV